MYSSLQCLCGDWGWLMVQAGSNEAKKWGRPKGKRTEERRHHGQPRLTGPSSARPRAVATHQRDRTWRACHGDSSTIRGKQVRMPRMLRGTGGRSVAFASRAPPADMGLNDGNERGTMNKCRNGPSECRNDRETLDRDLIPKLEYLHMTMESLDRAYRANPFGPFSLRLADGRTLPVRRNLESPRIQPQGPHRGRRGREGRGRACRPAPGRLPFLRGRSGRQVVRPRRGSNDV